MALPAATETVTVPSAVGSMPNVNLLPETDAKFTTVPPVTVMSELSKPVTDSLNSTVNGIGSDFVGSVVEVVRLVVGPVVSVIVKLTVASFDVLPKLF